MRLLIGCRVPIEIFCVSKMSIFVQMINSLYIQYLKDNSSKNCSNHLFTFFLLRLLEKNLSIPIAMSMPFPNAYPRSVLDTCARVKFFLIDTLYALCDAIRFIATLTLALLASLEIFLLAFFAAFVNTLFVFVPLPPFFATKALEAAATAILTILCLRL